MFAKRINHFYFNFTSSYIAIRDVCVFQYLPQSVLLGQVENLKQLGKDEKKTTLKKILYGNQRTRLPSEKPGLIFIPGIFLIPTRQSRNCVMLTDNCSPRPNVSFRQCLSSLSLSKPEDIFLTTAVSLNIGNANQF